MPASPILTTCGQGVTSSVQGRDPKFQGVAEQRWRGGGSPIAGGEQQHGRGGPERPQPRRPRKFLIPPEAAKIRDLREEEAAVRDSGGGGQHHFHTPQNRETWGGHPRIPAPPPSSFHPPHPGPGMRRG